MAYLRGTLQLVGGENAHELRTVLDPMATNTLAPRLEEGADEADGNPPAEAEKFAKACVNLRGYFQTRYKMTELWTSPGTILFCRKTCPTRFFM
jgi:hypothetical protein